jgi:hypothetical protein
MHSRSLLASLGLLLSVSSLASAQEAPAPTRPALPPPFTCGLAASAGVTDAATAADLVCRQVARATRGGADAPGAYTVALQPLGRAVVLSLRVARADGTLDERTIRLSGIEEVPVVAPRLADALVQGRPLAETQQVDNLVGEEVRPPPRKPTETRWSLGVIGVSLPSTGAFMMPGLQLGVGYETPQFGALVDFRGATRGDSSGKGGSFASLSVGGRYFTSKDGVSPFIGGGFGWTGIWASDGNGSSFDGSTSGLFPWVEVGVQVFRLHQGRLTLSVRADVPWASVKSDRTTYGAPTASGVYLPPVTTSEQRYELPVTMGATYGF